MCCELCLHEALPGSDYCGIHDPDVQRDFLDERADAMRKGEYV